MKKIILLLCVLAMLTGISFAQAKVFIVSTADRREGISALLKEYKLPDLRGRKVIIKPNFNSDDPFPATTHLDTLKYVIQAIKIQQPASIAILERSGMGLTEKVLKNRGVMDLAKEEGVEVVNLDRLLAKDWVKRGEKGTHWRNGFLIPKVLLDADYVINLCCLKTHRFGGDFTLSLKNNVGLAAKWGGAYNYMWELHISPNQRKMIAEINRDIPNQLVIMDAIAGFSTEGPERGKLIEPGLILLSTDRVAIDAVGVALLRMHGASGRISQGKIFDQDQLKRAAELGIGVKSAEEIELVPVNPEARKVIPLVRPFLI